MVIFIYVWLPCNILEYVSNYICQKTCIITAGFSSMILKYIIVIATFQLVACAKGKTLLVSLCTTNHGHASGIS